MSYTDTTGILLGKQEQRMEASNAPQQKKKMDQDSFLKILVAQLTHQDPLKPMEDAEMTSQLAEFSSLEQLTNINKGIASLGKSMEQTDMLSAVSFIGKEVKAQGYRISLDKGNASSVYYGFGEPVTGIRMNIYDKEGAIIRTVKLGSKKAGSYQYEWDGKNQDGKTMPDGQYGIGIIGEDAKGKHVMVRTEISGQVDAVVNEEGKQYLRLKDGRFVNFLNIKEIVDPGSAAVKPTDTTSKRSLNNLLRHQPQALGEETGGYHEFRSIAVFRHIGPVSTFRKDDGDRQQPCQRQHHRVQGCADALRRPDERRLRHGQRCRSGRTRCARINNFFRLRPGGFRILHRSHGHGHFR